MGNQKLLTIKYFLLVVCGYLVGAFAFICVLMRQNIAIDNSKILILIGYFIFVLVVYFVVKKLLYACDPFILPIVISLNGIGLSEIFRIDLSINKYEEVGWAIKNQMVWAIVGALIMIIVVVVLRDHRKLRKYTWSAMIIGLILLVLPMLPIVGSEINGARVWVNLGPLGSFQPAEFSKVFFAIFFAGYLTQNSERLNLKLVGRKILGFQIPTWKDFAPIFIVWVLSIGVLVMQHDLGTSLLFFGMFVAQLYMATAKASWGIFGLLMFGAGSFVAYKLFYHVQARVAVWLDPLNPELYNRFPGGSAQLVQGLFAMANGSLFGVGLGSGYPILTPFSNSDFIYTALGEELGLTGLFAILLMYLLLIQRGISTALKSRDGFGKLLAAGISFGIALQLFVVVGGVTRVIPLTGLVLPFIARGGSALVANWFMITILLIISHQARKPHKSIKISEKDIASHEVLSDMRKNRQI